MRLYNFASSLNGPAELPLQYNEICIEISLKEKLCSLINASDSVRKGISFSPIEDHSNQYKSETHFCFVNIIIINISDMTLLYYSVSRVNLNICFVIDWYLTAITIDLFLSRNHGFQSLMQRLQMKNRKTLNYLTE